MKTLKKRTHLCRKVSFFFAINYDRMEVIKRKQIALMAEEKLPTQISLRPPHDKSLGNEDYYE